jgi:hypothetical protein
MSSVPAPSPARSRRRTATLSASALLGAIAVLAAAPGAGATAPVTTPSTTPSTTAGPTDGGQEPQEAPHAGDLLVNPSVGLVDGQRITFTASAVMGESGDVAYSYYASLCAGGIAEQSITCSPLAGPLWPVNGGLTAEVKVPAVIGSPEGAGLTIDCRTIRACTLMVFPYRSSQKAVAELTFAPARSKATAPKPVTARPRFTG